MLWDSLGGWVLSQGLNTPVHKTARTGAAEPQTLNPKPQTLNPKP